MNDPDYEEGALGAFATSKLNKPMQEAAKAFGEVLVEDDRVAQVVGAAAGVAVPPAAVGVTAATTGLAGGAAIMKTLAIAGFGLGAVAGIAVVGIGAVGCAWGTTKLVKLVRNRWQKPPATTQQ